MLQRLNWAGTTDRITCHPAVRLCLQAGGPRMAQWGGAFHTFAVVPALTSGCLGCVSEEQYQYTSCLQLTGSAARKGSAC